MNAAVTGRRLCQTDGVEMVRMWEFVSSLATTEVKHAEGSYWQRLTATAKARAHPYVCPSCGLLQYFVDPQDLVVLFPEKGTTGP